MQLTPIPSQAAGPIMCTGHRIGYSGTECPSARDTNPHVVGCTGPLRPALHRCLVSVASSVVDQLSSCPLPCQGRPQSTTHSFLNKGQPPGPVVDRPPPAVNCQIFFRWAPTAGYGSYGGSTGRCETLLCGVSDCVLYGGVGVCWVECTSTLFITQRLRVKAHMYSLYQ